MRHNLTLLLAAALLSTTAPAFAQTEDDTTEAVTITAKDDAPDEARPSYKKGGYLSSSWEGIFQSAALERPGVNRELSYLRFTFGLNLGVNYNYNFDEHFSVYAGLAIRNIGFTDKISDLTIKRRVYTIGVPLGFRIGNLGSKNFAIIGGGIDVPFNYREKSWTDRKEKTKFSEWFSDRTPHVMPYLTAGLGIKSGLIIKVNFYPSNFFNTSYEETKDGVTSRIYSGYDARLLTLNLGFDMPLTVKKKGMKS